MQSEFDNIETWDKIAQDYKRTSLFGRRLFPGEKKRLRALIGTPESLIDVGCGTGRHLRFLSYIPRIVGLDFSYNMLVNIPETIKRYLEIIQGNAAQIPFRDKQFDVAIMLGNALGNVKNKYREQTMEEVVRVAKTSIFELRIAIDEIAKDEIRYWKNDENRPYMSHTWTEEEIRQFFKNKNYKIEPSTSMKRLKMMYVIVHD